MVMCPGEYLNLTNLKAKLDYVHQKHRGSSVETQTSFVNKKLPVILYFVSVIVDLVQRPAARDLMVSVVNMVRPCRTCRRREGPWRRRSKGRGPWDDVGEGLDVDARWVGTGSG